MGVCMSPAKRCTVVLMFIISLMVATPISPAQSVPKIMCLGDSITDGFGGFASYRYHLWRDLQASGVAVDFVGPRSLTGYNIEYAPGVRPDTGQFGYYNEFWALFDRDQAGFSGATTGELETRVSQLAMDYFPDIVLIHAGGNDIARIQSPLNPLVVAEQNLRDIISLFRQHNPAIKVLLSTNIPRGDDPVWANLVPQLNVRIAMIASQMNTTQSPVRLVDMFTGYDLNSMMQGDRLHPNTAGEQFMADIWRRELTSLLAVPAPCPSIPSPTPPTSLVALYTFDDGTLRDVSSSDNKLWAGFGAPQVIATGYEGAGLALDGSSYLRADVLIDPGVRPQLTMGAWVKVANNSVQALLSHDDGDFDRTIAITSNSGLGWSVFRGLGFGNGVLGAFPATPSQWQFVAAVYDTPSQSVRLYVDGQLLTAIGGPCAAQYQRLTSGYLRACACGQNLWVGKNPFNNGGSCAGSPNSTFALNGVVDNVFVVSEALSVERLDEIRAFGYRRIPTCASVFQQPRCVTACAGSPVDFMVDAGGSGGVTFQWRRNGVPIPTTGVGANPSANTRTLLIANTTHDVAGTYTCVVANLCGSVTTAAATLTVRTCCDSIDFNQNSVFPEDQDVIDFFNVLAGGECSPGNTCSDIDFNNNTVFPEDQDVIDFFTVLAGGECT
jgi:lysophospholipase L1-like esterase